MPCCKTLPLVVWSVKLKRHPEEGLAYIFISILEHFGNSASSAVHELCRVGSVSFQGLRTAVVVLPATVLHSTRSRFPTRRCA